MKKSISTQSYVELLTEARTKVEGFLASTADKYIPKLYRALRNENRDMSVKEARKRIQNDCAGMWARRTIRHAMPDEAKDPKKQEAAPFKPKEGEICGIFCRTIIIRKGYAGNNQQFRKDHRGL